MIFDLLQTKSRIVKIAFLAIVILMFYLTYVIYVWAHTETTDNAYVEADISNISSEIDGVISEILVNDNTPVKAGQIIAKLNNTNNLAYYEKACAEFEGAKYQIEIIEQDVVIAKIEQTKAQEEFEFAEINLAINQTDYTRTTKLNKDNFTSNKRLDETEIAFERAKNTYSQAKLNMKMIVEKLALLEIQKLAAIARLKSAAQEKILKQKALSNTEIFAPIDGMLGNSSLKIGNYIRTGVALFSIIPINQLYIKANFKETQISKFKEGMKVVIEFDSEPGEIIGKIRNISPATGSKFTLLPPANATGNFTKIVQRVPVLIDFDMPDKIKNKIVPGMSVLVKVTQY
jgi:membrane fusion protein (multidrug efflux system)